jgi:hypothetical protein
MSQYYNIKTNAGDAAIATALANNTKLNITHVAFGDGGGSVPTPSKNRTTLVHEVHRQAVNKYTQHPTITKWLTVEAIIPSNIGGFWIREIGVIADNVLISHGSHAPFFKVADTEGVSEYRLKFTIDIQDASIVQLTLDESLIYATQAWVNENYVPRADIVNNLTTADATKTLSAEQGRKLEQKKVDKISIRKTFGNTYAPLAGAGYDFNNIMPGDYVFNDASITTLNSPPFEYASVYCEGSVANDDQRFVIARDYFSGKLAVRGKQNGIWSGWSVVAFNSDNVASATKLQTARTINGVSFDGSANITIADNTKLPLTGGTITGSLNVSDTITITNVGDQAGAFKKLIQAYTTTDGGYIAVGNNAADKGYVEIGTIDDADTEIYARKRNTSGQVLQQATILDPYGNTCFPGETSAKCLGINNVEGNGAGLSLYGGAVVGLPQYGISFAKTFNFGGHGYVTSDWATYFTTTGGNNRGWIFRSGDSGNVASISAQGVLSIPTMRMERSNFQIEHYPTFSIYYDFATRIVRIVMKVQRAAGIGTADSPFKFVDNRYTANFSLPITLQLRLSAEFHFNNVGLAGYAPWHEEAAEWLTWCAPVGLRGSTESAVTVDIMRWLGGRGEAIDGYLIVTGFF